jgi:hypothetical protein
LRKATNTKAKKIAACERKKKCNEENTKYFGYLLEPVIKIWLFEFIYLFIYFRNLSNRDAFFTQSLCMYQNHTFVVNLKKKEKKKNDCHVK